MLQNTCATALKRFSSGGHRLAQTLVYDAPGEPLDVLKLVQYPLGSPESGQVEVRFLQAPINPSDINTVQGKYPIQPALPGGVPGHEGVAEVVAVGPGVQGMQPGDWVVPLDPAQGTWRERAVLSAAGMHKVPRDIPLADAATLCINPPTALAMLETYVELHPGDVVIQNGATSAVGQAVIQLAKAKGLKTVNIIRQRPNWDETVAWLKGLGADLVTTETKLKEDMRAHGFAGSTAAPKLGLNCVGGSAALAVAKSLGDGGTMVTYGGMSMQPVTIPTSLLIFKDLRFRGFWLSGRYAKEQGRNGRAAMLDRIVEYIRSGGLHTKVQVFPLEQYKDAFEAYGRSFRGVKIMLQPSPPSS